MVVFSPLFTSDCAQVILISKGSKHCAGENLIIKDTPESKRQRQ